MISRRLFGLTGTCAWLLPSPTIAQDQAAGFAAWLTALQREAVALGIRPRTLEAALAGLSPIARVVELDRKQPEATMGFSEYYMRVVNDLRVRNAKQRMADNVALLRQIAERFRVPPSVIVALWALETDFGRLTGNFPVIGALATLAFEGRRAEYFRKELIDALWILDEGRIPVAQLRGSWAGAMGQVQFMPSTYRRFALDWDGDGRRDIWGSTGDALASAANYLSQSGWVANVGWGEEVRAPGGLDPALTGRANRRPPEEWQRLGVLPLGKPVFGLTQPFALVLPDKADGRAFAVTRNIDVLMTWNRSIYFALSIAHLADRIDTD